MQLIRGKNGNESIIKQLIRRKRVGNTCLFGQNTTIDSKAKFKGMNRISDGSFFLNSFMGYASYVSDHSFIKNTVIGNGVWIGTRVAILEEVKMADGL